MVSKRELRSYQTRQERPVCSVLSEGKESTLYDDATQENVNQGKEKNKGQQDKEANHGEPPSTQGLLSMQKLLNYDIDLTEIINTSVKTAL